MNAEPILATAVFRPVFGSCTLSPSGRSRAGTAALSPPLGLSDEDAAFKGFLFGVADAAGEREAERALALVADAYYASQDGDRLRALEEAVGHATRRMAMGPAIGGERKRTGDAGGSPATITAALCYRRGLVVARTGGGSAFRLHGGGIVTVAGVGELPPIVHHLSSQSDVSGGRSRIVLTAVELHPGDRIVLGTTGLPELVKPGEVLELVRSLGPRRSAEAMAERARRRGWSDALATIVITAPPPPSSAVTESSSPMPEYRALPAAARADLPDNNAFVEQPATGEWLPEPQSSFGSGAEAPTDTRTRKARGVSPLPSAPRPPEPRVSRGARNAGPAPEAVEQPVPPAKRAAELVRRDSDRERGRREATNAGANDSIARATGSGGSVDTPAPRGRVVEPPGTRDAIELDPTTAMVAGPVALSGGLTPEVSNPDAPSRGARIRVPENGVEAPQEAETEPDAKPKRPLRFGKKRASEGASTAVATAVAAAAAAREAVAKAARAAAPGTVVRVAPDIAPDNSPAVGGAAATPRRQVRESARRPAERQSDGPPARAVTAGATTARRIAAKPQPQPDAGRVEAETAAPAVATTASARSDPHVATVNPRSELSDGVATVDMRSESPATATRVDSEKADLGARESPAPKRTALAAAAAAAAQLLALPRSAANRVMSVDRSPAAADIEVTSLPSDHALIGTVTTAAKTHDAPSADSAAVLSPRERAAAVPAEPAPEERTAFEALSDPAGFLSDPAAGPAPGLAASDRGHDAAADWSVGAFGSEGATPKESSEAERFRGEFDSAEQAAVSWMTLGEATDAQAWDAAVPPAFERRNSNDPDRPATAARSAGGQGGNRSGGTASPNTAGAWRMPSLPVGIALGGAAAVAAVTLLGAGLARGFAAPQIGVSWTDLREAAERWIPDGALPAAAAVAPAALPTPTAPVADLLVAPPLSATPLPTYTPYPTYTPPATYTPVPTATQVVAPSRAAVLPLSPGILHLLEPVGGVVADCVKFNWEARRPLNPGERMTLLVCSGSNCTPRNGISSDSPPVVWSPPDTRGNPDLTGGVGPYRWAVGIEGPAGLVESSPAAEFSWSGGSCGSQPGASDDGSRPPKLPTPPPDVEK